MDPQYQYRLLDEIDARQDEVITQLDELNDQIEEIIRQIVDQRSEAPASQPVSLPEKRAA